MKVHYFSVTLQQSKVLTIPVLVLELCVKVGNDYLCVNCFNGKSLLLTDSAVYSDCYDGALRLEGSSNTNEGRIEMCINNAWGAICDVGWSVTAGNIVCAQLGFQYYG